MPQFVLMSRLAPETMHDAGKRRTRGREWLQAVKEHCPEVQWISHHALLGRYDFMDIYEAPDVETAQKVSMISRSHGAILAESWPAIPYETYLGLMEDVAG